MKRSTFFGAIIGLHFVAMAILLYLRSTAPAGWDFTLLLIGNSVLAAVCLVGYLLSSHKPGNRPAAFFRGIASGAMLKLFVVAGGVVVYVLMNNGEVHQPSLLVLGLLYIIYTALETVALQRSARAS